MKIRICLLICLIVLSSMGNAVTQSKTEEENRPLLRNPVSVDYLKKKLRKTQPRLVFNAKIEKELKRKMETDQVLRNMYNAIQLNAESIFDKPLLTRKMIGRRLLSTSREMLWRINMLGFVYRMEKDPKVLERINDEVTAVCNFSDWNPPHFLDVAEMAMAVAFALDWTAGDLPESTQKLARTALIEKGIKPSWPEKLPDDHWTLSTHNWNQVCNGGMIAASIVIAETNPELAANTIARALDVMPYVLAEYMPDGIYPEGSGYWDYGTSFSVVTVAMLESAFNDDFGITNYPGFMESALFKKLCDTPSEWYFNFADCGDKRNPNGDLTLAWFATKTGNASFYEKERFLKPAKEMGRLYGLDGAGMVWLSQFEEKAGAEIPQAWSGQGARPLVILTGGEERPDYYFGATGGSAFINHGNMDGASFIFELNGVRWVVDPGNQNYHELEKNGFDLWTRTQESQRWTLLTKNNFGHSTITVNNKMHLVEGKTTLVSFEAGETPKAVFDLTAPLGDLVAKAVRTFVKDSPASVVIEDELTKSDKTEEIAWQLMTTADVQLVQGGAILRKDGKELSIENLSHPEVSFSVIALSPPPLKLDRNIEGLKRLEIRIPAWYTPEDKIRIKVRLSGK